jgi:thiol:disulfide interchange protein
VALSSARVAAELAAKGVAALKADWTRRDPVITAALAGFGRGGVPLYVLYRPGAAEPVILPQLLTESLLLQTLQTL